MTQAYIKVISGQYCGKAINNVVFPLVKPYTKHGDQDAFVTVDGTHIGAGEKIRIKVNGINDIEVSTVDAFIAQDKVEAVSTKESTAVSTETDEEVIARIGTRFEILHEMTRAACAGNIRAMIVTGPPGVGKSFGVEAELERASLFDKIANRRIRSNVVKGAVTPIGLYQVLYQYSNKDDVLVFDDSDQIFFDDLALNLLKAALDTGKTRKISWNSESSTLRREGIPESFNFNGSIIFITNLSFSNVKSKKLQEHLIALESRCHFLDLTLDTVRDKLLRIRQIANTGELFNQYDLAQHQQDEIIEFLFANQPKLREVSLRTALKIADLYTSFPTKWKEMAAVTVMRSA